MKKNLACVLAALIVSIAATSTAECASEVVAYSFQDNGSDGMEPYAGLISVKGMLYGTTGFGGTGTCTRESPYGCGTVFLVDPAAGIENVVYSFQNNKLDGISPNGLIKVDKNLYGTAGLGGTKGNGAVFAIDLVTGAETVLYSFCEQQYCRDGGLPQAGLIDVNGALYGTTNAGGEYNYGTVFSLDPATKTENVLYSFCSKRSCQDGEIPQSALLDVRGKLYGTTISGGAQFAGTVFAIDPSSRTEAVVYSFCGEQNCDDGLIPDDALITLGNRLYGTTNGGGLYNQGTIFSLDIATGKEKVLYSFQGGNDGAQPIAGLINVGDMLYGTTGNGGSDGCDGGTGCGTVFSFDRVTGREKVLHAFQDNGADGIGPEAGVINVNGTLYGTTVYGGTYGYGTVYKIKP
ncbi:MAG TPA: choice-of-anchor tandem repeat GloVer-containing protein [Rhizomicrobium sp.]|nr:choice-of-anchor tandem repeat GloVer-containing protein [Rhizomicrobium sp.]